MSKFDRFRSAYRVRLTAARVAVARFFVPELPAILSRLDGMDNALAAIRDEFEAVVSHAKDLERELEDLEIPGNIDDQLEELEKQIDKWSEDYQDDMGEHSDRLDSIERFLDAFRSAVSEFSPTA